MIDFSEIDRIKTEVYDPNNPVSRIQKQAAASIRFYYGTVENNKDPKKLGRVKVLLSILGEKVVSDWAPVIRPFSGKQMGFWALPDVGDMVVCLFLNDNPDCPVVMGSVYHEKAKPPVKEQAENNIKTLKTKGGSEIIIDDTNGKEKLSIKMKDGKMLLELDKKKGISIKNDLGNIRIKCKKFSLNASGDGSLKTTKAIKVTAQGIITEAKSMLNAKGSAQTILKGQKVELQGIVLAQNRPAAKQNDLVVGVDIHMIDIPSPAGPVPTPLPHPFMGKIDGKLSSNVKIKGKPVAVMGSIAKHNPPGHIPMGPKFTKNPKNQGELKIGTVPVVKVNGKDIAVMGTMVMTCNDPADMPTGSVIAIP